MRRLIDIAGRTGHAPVRALLSAAVGTSDVAELRPHEIRYRNDQHHVIYGLYEDDRILGLIGLARIPAQDSVEIRHFAVTPDVPEAAGELVDRVLARQASAVASWRVSAELEQIARSAGFRPDGESDGHRVWIRILSQSKLSNGHCR